MGCCISWLREQLNECTHLWKSHQAVHFIGWKWHFNKVHEIKNKNKWRQHTVCYCGGNYQEKQNSEELKLVTSGERGWGSSNRVGNHFSSFYINYSVYCANIMGFVCFYILRPRKGSGEISVVKRKGLNSFINVVSTKAFVHLCCFFLFVCSGYQSFHIYVFYISCI